ncbi:MAG TPA: DUF927 domain-containing protein [Firmicutes bacterium]|nr:DUF927 domain-containing protein [Bacillota bacterium]
MITTEDLEEVGFFDFDPEKLDKEEILEEKIFERIFAIPSSTDRIRLIGKLTEQAERLRVKTTFKALLREYQSDFAQKRRQSGSNTIQFTSPPLQGLKCGEWEATDSGIIKIVGSGADLKRLVACPHPIIPIERLQNVETDTEKIKLSYFKDRSWKNVTVDRSMIATRTGIVKLSDFGVDVTSESAKDLVSYLGDVINLNDIPLTRSITRLGWVHDKFVPFDGELAFDGDQEFKTLFDSVREHGKFETWLEEARRLRAYSVYNRLLLAASFASPLVSLLGISPFIVHFWGGTGVGKTVGLMLAASVWGDPKQGKMVRSLNSTQVGMERNSVFLHDLPFIGDELQIVKSNFDNFDKLIMYLCEGVGRGRGRSGGGIEAIGNWNCAYIFSGEEPITKSSSGGGAKNRVIEVECASSLVKDGNRTANLLRDNYGFAGKRFLEVLPTTEELRDLYQTFHAEIMTTGTTEKQAMAMSAIMVADEIASVEVFGDKALEFAEVLPYVMSASDVDVAARAYEWVCDWVAQNMAHFRTDQEFWGEMDFERGYCWVLKSVLEKAMRENGYDYRAIMSKWAESDVIERNSQGKFVHQRVIRSIKASYIKLTKLTLVEKKVS